MEQFAKQYLDVIMEFLNITNENRVYKIGSFSLLFLAFFLCFIYLKKTQIIQNSMKNAMEQLILNERYQLKESMVKLQRKPIIIKWQNHFTYSGLNKYFPFLTAELWFVAIVIFSAVGYFVSSIFTRSLLVNLSVAILVGGLMFIIETLMSYYNFQKTDNNLLQFLNMLGNFSLTSGEITSVFRQVAKHVDDPIRTALIECYNEAQTRGNPVAALRAMSAKIEHPKFKEIIKNLECAIRYSADFKVIVDGNRKIVQDYLNSKQDRKDKAKENMISIFIITIILAALIGLSGYLVEINVWKILFHETIGKVCLGIAGGCYVYLFWKNYTINK